MQQKKHQWGATMAAFALVKEVVKVHVADVVTAVPEAA